MFKNFCLKFFLVVGLSNLFTVGCHQQNSEILAIIEGKDTITVAQFRERLKNTFDEQAVVLSFSEKMTVLNTLVEERLKLVYASELKTDYSDVYNEEIEKERLLLNKSYEKYILARFVNPILVKKYLSYYGKTLKVRNIVFSYQNNRNPALKTTKELARMRADSVRSILTLKNFSTLAEQVSDYKDKETGKGNAKVERMKLGNLPYNIEKEILSMKANTISKPIDIKWAFVIVHLVAVEDSVVEKKSIKEMERFLKEKLMGDDYDLILDYQNVFLDSLVSLAGISFDDNNIIFLTEKSRFSQISDLKPDQFSAEESERELVKYKSGKITIDSYLKRYPVESDVSLSAEIVKYNLIELLKMKQLADLGLKGGIANSEDFRNAMISRRVQVKLGYVNQTIAARALKRNRITEEEFYSQNKMSYRSDGSIVLSEIYTMSEDTIKQCYKLIKGDVSFEKILSDINKGHRNPSVKINANQAFSYNSKDELVRKAIRLKTNETSDIIVRKDGGYSIIKVMSKTEPSFLKFDEIKQKIQEDLTAYMYRIHETALVDSLKKRLRVIVYENNLNWK